MTFPAPRSGIWKSIFGSCSTDSIVYPRTEPPVNVVTGQNTFGLVLSGASSVQRPEIVPGVPVWISDANVAAGKRINKAAFTVLTGTAQGNLARNVLNGFGATEVDLPPGSSRFLQPVQSPQLRSPDQLHDLSPFRPSHPDARRLARRRRPESALPDRRPAFGATGAETYILKPKPVTTTADRRNQIPPHRLTATRQSEPNDGRRETVTCPAIPPPSSQGPFIPRSERRLAELVASVYPVRLPLPPGTVPNASSVQQACEVLLLPSAPRG